MILNTCCFSICRLPWSYNLHACIAQPVIEMLTLIFIVYLVLLLLLLMSRLALPVNMPITSPSCANPASSALWMPLPLCCKQTRPVETYRQPYAVKAGSSKHVGMCYLYTAGQDVCCITLPRDSSLLSAVQTQQAVCCRCISRGSS